MLYVRPKMSLVAKVAERVVEDLPHSVVDGAKELIIAPNVIAPGPDVIAPAGGVTSIFPYVQVLMGLALVAVMGFALLRYKKLSLRSVLPF